MKSTTSQNSIQHQLPQKRLSKTSLIFIIFVILWETAAIIIYGLFLGYDETINNGIALFGARHYLNIYLMVAFLIFVMVGLTLTSAYVTFSSATNMTFSIVIFVFTLQNWFIYRCYWHKTGLPRNPIVVSFNDQRYQEISFLPTENFRVFTSNYAVASFYDAIGACIAMFCALTPLLGRIGFLQIFLLSLIGPFMYQFNSSIFNRFQIVDPGFGMRGFLFGGMMGLFIQFLVGKKSNRKIRKNYMSHYHTCALALIGCVIICLTYPSLVSTALQYYNNGTATTIAAVVQINMWLAMSGSVIGVFIANSLAYRKISVHDVIFASLSGAIAFSSSSSINFNPGAAIAIGSAVGLFCGLLHTPIKKIINRGGVKQTNSALVPFVVPGIIACICSSILQAINQGQYNLSISGSNTQYAQRQSSRTASQQAGWQLMGFVFSLGSALLCGILLGFIFKASLLHRPYWYFLDWRLIDFEFKKEKDQKRPVQ